MKRVQNSSPRAWCKDRNGFLSQTLFIVCRLQLAEFFETWLLTERSFAVFCPKIAAGRLAPDQPHLPSANHLDRQKQQSIHKLSPCLTCSTKQVFEFMVIMGKVWETLWEFYMLFLCGFNHRILRPDYLPMNPWIICVNFQKCLCNKINQQYRTANGLYKAARTISLIFTLLFHITIDQTLQMMNIKKKKKFFIKFYKG